MDSLSGIDEDSRRAGGCEGGSNLMTDDAGLADTGDDDLATTGIEGVDDVGKRCVDSISQRGQFADLLAENILCSLDGIHL